MQSPAKKHKQHVMSRMTLANNGTADGFGSAHDMLKLKMVEDRRELKTLQSIKAKIELKAELLPHYDDWLDATLEHGKGKADPLLATLMLWHIDAGSFKRGLDIAEYMLEHDLSMPDAHKRTPATVVAEEIADTAKQMITDDVEFDIGQVLRASTITADHDMPDQVRAKIARIIGELTEESDPESALAHYKTALSFDERSGVKGAIKRLEKTLAADTGATEVTTAENGNDDDEQPAEEAKTES